MTVPLVGPGDHAGAGLPEGGDKLIKADRPLALEESILRASVLPGLLRSISHNVRHRADEVWLYEIGPMWERPADLPPDPSVLNRHVTGPEGGLPHEQQRLAVALWPADAYAAVDAWTVLADSLRLEKPAIANAAERGRRAAPDTHRHRHRRRPGHRRHRRSRSRRCSKASAIEGRVAWLDVDLAALHAAPRRSPIAKDVSRFPSSDIDLAFVVPDEVAAGDVLNTLDRRRRRLARARRTVRRLPRHRRARRTRRSLAFSLRFCALDRTLTDAEVGERRAACIAAVEKKHRATLRG